MKTLIQDTWLEEQRAIQANISKNPIIPIQDAIFRYTRSFHDPEQDPMPSNPNKWLHRFDMAVKGRQYSMTFLDDDAEWPLTEMKLRTEHFFYFVEKREKE